MFLRPCNGRSLSSGRKVSKGTKVTVDLCASCDGLSRRQFNSRRGKKRSRKIPIPTPWAWLEILRRAWDSDANVFRCGITGVQLDPADVNGPLYPTLDHIVPGTANWTVAASVFNDMKNDHTRQEFVRNILVLAQILSEEPARGHELADRFVSVFRRGADGISNWHR